MTERSGSSPVMSADTPERVPGPVVVRRLGPQEWALARSVRLDMLRESRAAFCARIEDEERQDESFWRRRCTDGDTFVALVDGQVAGGASLVVLQGVPNLVGMWVAPAHRGTAAGRSLVEAVLARARRAGHRQVFLDVVDGNPRARRFYERLGFVPTGRRQPAPMKDGVVESQLVRVL